MSPDVRGLEVSVKPVAVTVLFLLLASCASTPRSAGSDAATSAAVEQEVLRVEDTLLDALVRRDVETLERLLGSEFVLSGANAALETRAQYLESAKTPDRELAPLTMEEREVRVYGGTAVTVGRVHLRGQWVERKLDLRLRYTHVYAQRDGRWQAVAAHLTIVSGE
jgi:ketosteroid isomerase-like protein